MILVVENFKNANRMMEVIDLNASHSRPHRHTTIRISVEGIKVVLAGIHSN